LESIYNWGCSSGEVSFVYPDNYLSNCRQNQMMCRLTNQNLIFADYAFISRNLINKYLSKRMKNIFKKLVFRFAAIALCIVLITMVACKKDNNADNEELNNQVKMIAFLTEHYPPLNYEQEGKLYGVSVDILEGLFDKMNVNLTRNNVVLKNWSEAYQQTLNQAHTMLFSTARIPERESLFKWVGPIAPEKTIVLALTANNIEITAITELNNYSVGVIRDYAAILMLTDQGVLPEAMVSFNDVEHLYNALSNGDVDCIVYSETGNTLIIESLGMNAADVETVYLAGVVENYFAFNAETSDEIITLFQQYLDQLKLDKTGDGSSVYEKILNNYQVIQHINDNITAEMVIALVEQTATDIAADAAGTFAKMNQHLAPYKDQVNPALYSFAYDTAINMVAHADNELLVGVNFRGKTDAAGKKFRDEIVAGALEHQTGWTDYIYTKPDQSGLYYKTTYYQLVTGSDGAFYIICAGRFK